jgi:hypothetical protein
MITSLASSGSSRIRRLRVFLGWSAGDRRLWLIALVVVGCARLGLWLLPVRTVRGKVRRLAQGLGGRLSPRPTPREVAGAVTSASRYVPSATCLVRALTVQALLEAQGWPVRLRIGVAGAPGWAAHAWVEDAHGPVTEADSSVARLTPVVTFAEDQVGD